MAKLHVLPILAAAALILLPAAQAQNQVDSTSTVAITAGSLATLNPGSAGSVDLTVRLTLTNLICTGQGSATVALTVGEVAPVNGITATVEPASLTFNVGTGPGVVTTTGELSQAAKLNVTLAPNAPSRHDHAYNVTASFPGMVTNCQPANPTMGGVPSASASVAVPFTTGGNGGNTTGTGTMTGTGAGTGTDPNANGSPLADVPTVALLVVGAAFVALRRRTA